MSTELAIRQENTVLTVDPEQTQFNDSQVAALRHMGVENATDGDLGVFFHVVKRTGLDPFARQIYMVGRNTKDQRSNKWVTKYTIQTGIDGYRLIGRRAADARRESISVSAPEWAHEDGTWRPVWRNTWGLPVGARVVIHRNGQPFTAVALFDEYKQTKRDGGLTSMWVQRPAGQIAKCAEALAWRMSFPQDLAGVYVEDEMHRADVVDPPPQGVERSGAARMRSTLNVEQPAPLVDTLTEDQPERDDADGPLTDNTRKRMFALLNELGVADDDQQRAGMSKILGREVESRTTLTEGEGRIIVLDLLSRQGRHEPPQEGADG